jgi:membrane protease subunit (stomatin/prohibitin family)
MAGYQNAQEFKDLRWGTGMPVAVLVGGQVVQARAYGTCAVVVTDPVQLAEHVPDPESLPDYVRSQATLAVTDMLGERSMHVTDLAQFTAINPATYQALRDNLEPRLAAIGLKLKAMRIEAIDRL